LKNIREYILVGIFLLLFSTCVKHNNINNEFVRCLIKNKNDISIYLVNDEATNEFNKIYHENGNKIYDEKGKLIRSYIIPDNDKLFDLLENTKSMEEIFSRYLILQGVVIQIGKNISKIDAKKDETGIIVTCFLDTEGRKKFYEFTSSNIGRNLAMVMNNKIIFHATILRPLENSINFVIPETQK